MYTLTSLAVLLIPVAALCGIIFTLLAIALLVTKIFGDRWGYIVLMKVSGSVFILLAVRSNVVLLGCVGGGLVALAYIFSAFIGFDYLKRKGVIA